MALLGACSEGTRVPARASQQFALRPEALQCLSQLGATKASFTPLPDRYFGAGCATLNTVRLASLRGDEGVLGITNLGPVTCPLASTFAAWARFGVDRAARQILGSELVRIETMGSFSCRNIAGSDRLSAHANANAIDVSGFVLADGRRITVVAEWNGGSWAEREFLRVIYISACKRFGTVLGPAYNAAHANHLHLERSDSAFCR
ncbi:MAG: extensin family protein [Novosphingobium sp.]